MFRNTVIDKQQIVDVITKGSDILRQEYSIKLSNVAPKGQGLRNHNYVPKVDLYYFDYEDSEEKGNTLNEVYLINRFYGGSERITPERSYSVIFNTLYNFSKSFYDKSYIENLKKCFFEPIKVTRDEFIDEIFNSEEKTEYHDFLIELEQPSSTALACLGVFLCLTGKKLDANNKDNWDTVRYNSFISKVRGDPHGLVKPYCPTEDFSIHLDAYLSSISSTRGLIFAELKGGLSTPMLGEVFRIVLNNLQWFQMTNFWLVTEILVKNHAYILLWGEAAKYTTDYRAAVEQYGSYGENFKYIKYIDQNVPANLFNGHGIKILAEMARRIGTKTNMASMANFKTNKGTINISAKLEALVDIASDCNFAWADYVRDHILPECPENKEFYKECYSKFSTSDAQSIPNMIKE